MTGTFDLGGRAAPPMVNGEVVFEAPWQGRVFGMAHRLAEQGVAWDDFFYAPAQIVRDAREHGVTVRAPDVNLSGWDSLLERDPAIAGPVLRLGLREVDGLAQAQAQALVAARGAQPFATLAEVRERAGVTAATLERLASVLESAAPIDPYCRTWL